METRTPTIDNHGLVAFHDQACAVLHTEPAVLDCQTGVFAPSWKAQAMGWRIVRATTWYQRLALRLSDCDR